MALAIKFQAMVDRAEVTDYADLAGLGYVTRARLTQIMNLLLLEPNLQEEILASHLPLSREGVPAERDLRSVAKLVLWEDQKTRWMALRAQPQGDLAGEAVSPTMR
jgi:hypothetical protein